MVALKSTNSFPTGSHKFAPITPRHTWGSEKEETAKRGEQTGLRGSGFDRSNPGDDVYIYIRRPETTVEHRHPEDFSASAEIGKVMRRGSKAARQGLRTNTLFRIATVHSARGLVQSEGVAAVRGRQNVVKQPPKDNEITRFLGGIQTPSFPKVF